MAERTIVDETGAQAILKRRRIEEGRHDLEQTPSHASQDENADIFDHRSGKGIIGSVPPSRPQAHQQQNTDMNPAKRSSSMINNVLSHGINATPLRDMHETPGQSQQHHILPHRRSVDKTVKGPAAEGKTAANPVILIEDDERQPRIDDLITFQEAVRTEHLTPTLHPNQEDSDDLSDEGEIDMDRRQEL